MHGLATSCCCITMSISYHMHTLFLHLYFLEIEKFSYLYAGYRVRSIFTGEVKYVWRRLPGLESGAKKIDTMGKILMLDMFVSVFAQWHVVLIYSVGLLVAFCMALYTCIHFRALCVWAPMNVYSTCIEQCRTWMVYQIHVEDVACLTCANQVFQQMTEVMVLC